MGFTLHGNDPGTKILAGGLNEKQKFDRRHEIFKGVLNIHEGVTIARPKCDQLPLGV